MEFTAENLAHAVHEFYRESNNFNTECHEWLRNCQASREAWTIVWPLLQTSSSQTVNVQYTAANILYNKITRNWNEVPAEDYAALKDNLVAAVARFVSGPPLVLIRLELALAAFIASTIGDVWPNPFDDLGNLFQPRNFPGVPEEKVLILLVQIFGHVPEQAESVWQHSSRKGQAYRELQSKGDAIFIWLFSMVKVQPSVDVTKEAIKSMIPWMKMLSICEFPDLNLLLDSLVELCKNSVPEEDFTLCENCVEMLSSVISDPNTHLFPSVVLTLLDKVLLLQPTLETIVELQDMELCVTMYGMYVALADCHSKLIVDICDEESSYNKTNPQNRGNALKLIDILLKCVGSPGAYPVDEVVSSITISVWYSFVEEIQPKQTDRLKYGRLMQVFEWVYKALAEILIRKSTFPRDDSIWNREEKEQFRIYRQDICDCLTYCFELRGWTMLNELIDMAEANLRSIEDKPDLLRNVWHNLESLLMGIRAVTENISDDRDPLLVAPLSRALEVILRVLKINQQNRIPELYQAALECISSCSGMLHSFSGTVKSLVGYILEGLFIRESSMSATLALKAMSRDCTKALSEFTPTILSSCKQALDCGSLTQNDSIRLVFCIGKFLPYLPTPEIISAVNEIFAPMLQRLHGIADQDAQPELRAQLLIILRIMSTLCSSLDQYDSDDEEDEEDEMSESDSTMTNNNISSQVPGSSQASNVIEQVNPRVNSSRSKKDQSSQPLIPVVEQILPVLIPLAEKWSRDEEVMDSLFSILKHTLTTIHTASTLVIEYAIKLVLISFRIFPVMAATGLAKQTILMLGTENFHMQCQFLQEMHPHTEKSLRNPREYLEFVESYYIFIAHLIKNNTQLVNASAINLDFMLAMALEIVNYAEAPLLKAGIWFIQVTISKAKSLAPPLVDFYQSHGLVLIQKVILAIGHLVPRSVVHYFSDIFLALNREFPGDWRKWLQEALAPPGFPSGHCTNDAKNILFLKLTRERVNKRAVSDAITEFSLACRNLSGSDYGTMTSKTVGI